MTRAGWLLCLLGALLYPSVQRARADALGENDPVYREHVQAALAAYDAGDLAKAHALFEAAYARYPNARALRGLGTVELEQKDHVSAAAHLEQALASSELPLTGSLRQQTEAALREANANVGRVLVLSSPADAEVRLDDRLLTSGVATVLAPGVYTLALSAPGYRSESRQLMLSASQSQLIHWSLERVVVEPPPPVVSAAPVAPPPAARASTKPWLLIGVGSAVAVSGVALLAVGIHNYRQLGDATSYADWQDERDRYPRLAGVGGALLGVGALAVATGVWWRVQTTRDVRISFSADRLLVGAHF